MSELVTTSGSGAALTGEVLAHLETQLISVRRLLHVVLEQGAAIRRRDVQAVVHLTGVLQAELQRRAQLENQRSQLLERAGAQLGIAPAAVTISLLQRLMNPASADLAAARSAELRGLLSELQREHYVNRALMTQELAFVDHLLRLADPAASGPSYDAAGEILTALPSLSPNLRVLDLEV